MAFFRVPAPSRAGNRPHPGAADYSPKKANRAPINPTFGSGSRFNYKHYISEAHQADAKTHNGSPGPAHYRKESSEHMTQTRAPLITMSPQHKHGDPEVFMASATSYSPKNSSRQTASPRAVFGNQQRFANKKLFPVGPADHSPTASHMRRSASYSFAEPGEPLPANMRMPVTKDRYITHNIRGQRARPATSDFDVSPAEYTPQTDFVRTKNHVTAFGRADRFMRDGLQFTSTMHSKSEVDPCSPGPVYYTDKDQQQRDKNVLGAKHKTFSWVPN